MGNFNIPSSSNVTGANGVPHLSPTSKTAADPTSFILDRDWVKQAFLISNDGLQATNDQINRFWSSASAKFTSATLGGNIGVNNRPQYTRYCDIRDPGRLPGRNSVSLQNVSGNYGMGRYYSEAIDDNAQKIFLRFGVPQYNSLTNFILNAANAEWTQVARTGRVSTAYAIGKAIGTIGVFIAFPVISTVIFAGEALNSLFFNSPTSKYYTLKPTMELYWSTVNMLVNTIGVNKGLIPAIISDTLGNKVSKIDNAYTFNGQELSQLSEMFPGVMDSAGYFDVYAIAARPQSLANQLFEADYQGNYTSTAPGILSKANSGGNSNNTYTNNTSGKHSLASRLNNMFMFGSYYTHDKDAAAPGIETDPRSVSTPTEATKNAALNGLNSAPPPVAPGPGETTPTSTSSTEPTSAPGQTAGSANPSFLQQMGKYLNSNFRDGAEFAVFQVDFTGSVSESFSNSVQESALESKINDMSGNARQARFSFEDGNIVGGAVGDAIGAVVGAAKNVAEGVLDGVTFGLGGSALAALGVLAGNGLIDIPKTWSGSAASLPRSNYTMQLISPYGNVISQMTNIYIPLCMLLAGTLPLSTGKQSYTSPFLVQLWDRGRMQIQLGMIDSLSITRGVSNLAFTNMGSPLAIDVSFTVTDLSSIMHMPVSTGSLFGGNATLDADNILMDYLAVLAGQDIYSQVYALPKAKLNLAKKINSFKKYTSPAFWASTTHEQVTSGMLSYVTGPIANGIEGLVQGNSVIVNPISN